MDDDSSTKFIESLTKFLQSLCNGYVEFQKGVELVGHIYLNIDTGEKVDYILHEKVSKNDENSVTFVSNSFHALAKEKDKNKAPGDISTPKTYDPRASSDDDDDDIVIVDQPDSVLGSTNSGTVPSRGLKRAISSNSDQRRVGLSFHRGQSGGSNHRSPPWRNRQQSGPAATMSSQSTSQENISIGEVKLEQLSSDELLSLASQVGDGTSSSQVQGRPGGAGRSDHASFSPNDAPGQPWVKQEPMDESQGGLDTGWSQSDSSNSGSNLYPVMMHQNSAAFTSGPMVPGFSSTSGSASSRHGFPHSLPGTSGAGNPFANPMPGTSQNADGMDPSDYIRRPPIRQPRAGDCSEYSKKYWQRVRENPEWYAQRLQTMRRRARELYAQNKEYYRQKSRDHYAKKRQTMAQFSMQPLEFGSSENTSLQTLPRMDVVGQQIIQSDQILHSDQ